jgi:hypothetical protein
MARDSRGRGRRLVLCCVRWRGDRRPHGLHGALVAARAPRNVIRSTALAALRRLCAVVSPRVVRLSPHWPTVARASWRFEYAKEPLGVDRDAETLAHAPLTTARRKNTPHLGSCAGATGMPPGFGLSEAGSMLVLPSSTSGLDLGRDDPRVLYHP